MRHNLSKWIADSKQINGIFKEMGFVGDFDKRVIGEIVEFVRDDAVPGEPLFRAAIAAYEVQWDMTETRRLKSICFYFAPASEDAPSGCLAIRLALPSRVAQHWDRLAKEEIVASGIFRFVPKTDETHARDRDLKLTVARRSRSPIPHMQDSRLASFYRVFGLKGFFGLLTTNIDMLIGKTMCFERRLGTEERIFEEAVFYGTLAELAPTWMPKADGSGEWLARVGFRFLPGSRLDGHWLEHIDLMLTEDNSAYDFVALTSSGEEPLPMRGSLYFID